jgi:hypothetical protein
MARVFPRRQARRPKTRPRGGWCKRNVQQRVEGPGPHRCATCGRRITAYPLFDDGWCSWMRKPPPGTGRDIIRREGIGAAYAWRLGPHKRSELR